MLVYQLSFVNAKQERTSMLFSTEYARALFIDENPDLMSHVSTGIYPMAYEEIDEIVDGIVSAKIPSGKKASAMSIEELVESVVRK